MLFLFLFDLKTNLYFYFRKNVEIHFVMKGKIERFKTRWMHYAILFRTQNLFIIALTMFLTHYALLKPLLSINTHSLQNEILFILLVLSCVFAAAAGYAINDYFDIRVDRINRPLKVVVGRYIERRKVILLHLILSIASFLISIALSVITSSYKIAVISLLVNTLLWFYSAYYKPIFLFGNFIVAVCTAFYSVYIVWVLDAALYSNILDIEKINLIGIIIWVYSLFAFLTTLLREIIKDIEDLVGDEKCGCKTIPIIIGIKNTKFILVFILLLIMGLLGYTLYYFNAIQQFLYLQFFIIGAMIIPFIWILFLILKANKAHQFSNISRKLKYVIVLGILSMLFFCF